MVSINFNLVVPQNKWMVCNGKPLSNGWFRGTPISGNLHVENGENLTIFMGPKTHPKFWTLSVYPIFFLGNFVTKAAVMELKVLCLPHDFAQSWVRGWLTVLLSCLSAQNYSNYTILYVYLGLNLPNQTITVYPASVSKSSWEFQYIGWNNIKQVHRSWCPTVALAWVSNNVHLHDEKIM